MKTDYTVGMQPGDASCRIAFLFSCPGRKEHDNAELVSGTTGDNLEQLLKYLTKFRPDIFPSTDKKFYRITNASTSVHYDALTNSSEDTDKNIKLDSNVERLHDEIANYPYLIVFGNKAKTAVKKVMKRYPDYNANVVYCNHTSSRGLNSIKKDIDGKRIESSNNKMIQRENTGKRIIVVFDCIKKQFDAFKKNQNLPA